MKINYLLSILCTITFMATNGMSLETENIKEMLAKGVLDNNLQVIEDAVKKGANINMKRSVSGQTLLMEKTNNKETIELLLKLGADPNIQDNNGITSLMLAVLSKNEVSVTLLLKANADLNIQENINGKTALMFATMVKANNIIKLLLENSNYTNLDIQNKDKGLTALMIAIVMFNIDGIKLLLNGNANLDIKHKKNGTALSLAKGFINQDNRYDEIVKILEEEQEKRNNLKLIRPHVQKIIQETTGLIPELADIISEYAVFAKESKKEQSVDIIYV